jgi:hypothetical protein
LTWNAIFEHWDLVWADLISEYGVDVGDRAMMRRRPWKSLRRMIAGLVSADTRLSRALNDQK